MPIAGFPAYEVSDRGRVRRCLPDARGRGMGRIFKPTRGRYAVAGLTRDGALFHVKVHTLVARAFLGPPPTDEHQVAHWDGNTHNNRLANLRWATAKENATDRERHGRTARGPSSGAVTRPDVRPRGEEHARAKLDEAKVRAIRLDSRPIKVIGRDYKVAFSTIACIKRRQTWKHVL